MGKRSTKRPGAIPAGAVLPTFVAGDIALHWWGSVDASGRELEAGYELVMIRRVRPDGSVADYDCVCGGGYGTEPGDLRRKHALIPLAGGGPLFMRLLADRPKRPVLFTSPEAAAAAARKAKPFQLELFPKAA